jgi:hypothetical protein
MNVAYLALLNIAAIGVLVVVIMVLISHWGGWASLAEQYRSQDPFPGPVWKFQCGQFRWLANYNNCLTVGADPRGLFLWILPPFRIAHPPLFIPWREISVTRRKILWAKQVRFCLGSDLRIPLTIREGLAQKLQMAAGSSWPVEPSSSSS